MRAIGLRTRVTAVFALGALALSVSLAGASYELVRNVLLDEREQAAVRAASLGSFLLRQGLDGNENPNPGQVLRNVETGELRRPLVRRNGTWYAASADTGLTSSVTPELLRLVEGGATSVQRVRVDGDPVLVVGVPLGGDAGYFEVTSLAELRRTLAVLATVLGAVALATTVGGAAVGWWASRVVLRPLAVVAQAAGSIAAGDLSARVDRDEDPDLDALGQAFNRMADEVSARSEAERRFAADVSHELRSPLQTLSAATSVLDRRRGSLDARTAGVVDLLTAEVARFEQLVTDLLELAKADRPADRRPVDVVALSRAALGTRRLPPDLLHACGQTTADVDPRRFEQLLVNLLDNAAHHGGGAVRVGLEVDGHRLVLEVDDDGPGVPADERDLVFRRFARGRAASARGGSEGTGLGLALVSQHVQAHRGTVEVLDRPGGGARFRVVLPAVAAAVPA